MALPLGCGAAPSLHTLSYITHHAQLQPFTGVGGRGMCLQPPAALGAIDLTEAGSEREWERERDTVGIYSGMPLLSCDTTHKKLGLTRFLWFQLGAGRPPCSTPFSRIILSSLTDTLEGHLRAENPWIVRGERPSARFYDSRWWVEWVY